MARILARPREVRDQCTACGWLLALIYYLDKINTQFHATLTRI